MKVQEGLERYRADALYFERERPRLLEQHPDSWVAVYHQQVVGVAKSLPVLIAQLKRRGIPRDKAFVEYVAEQEALLIL